MHAEWTFKIFQRAHGKLGTAVKSANRELGVKVTGSSVLRGREALLRLKFQLPVQAVSSGGYSSTMGILMVRIRLNLTHSWFEEARLLVPHIPNRRRKLSVRIMDLSVALCLPLLSQGV